MSVDRCLGRAVLSPPRVVNRRGRTCGKGEKSEREREGEEEEARAGRRPAGELYHISSRGGRERDRDTGRWMCTSCKLRYREDTAALSCLPCGPNGSSTPYNNALLCLHLFSAHTSSIESLVSSTVEYK
eukprot:scaffold233456_cov28-Tisochrysis_lutea.AAC.1